MPPVPVLSLYAVLSIVTFSVYLIDKSAARKRGWRIPENLLHLLALFGGWPGALMAQRLLRHKSRKRPFQIMFWVTVAINLCFLWLFAIR